MVTREVRAKSMIVKQRDCKSLLLSLLWDIGGAPPVLANIEGKVIHLRWILAFLILNGLFLSTSANSQQQWCGQSLEQQVIKMSLEKMSHGKCHFEIGEFHIYVTCEQIILLIRVNVTCHIFSRSPSQKPVVT